MKGSQSPPSLFYPAHLHLLGHEVISVFIEYCEGEVLGVVADQGFAALLSSRYAALVDKDPCVLVVPLEVDKHLRLQGRLVRLQPQRLDLRVEPGSVPMLRQITACWQKNRNHEGLDQQRRLVLETTQRWQQALPELIESFCQRVREHYLQLADNARSNQQQQRFYEAQKALLGREPTLLTQVSRYYDNWYLMDGEVQERPVGNADLTVVEQAEYEHALRLRLLSEQVAMGIGKPLVELLERLNHLGRVQTPQAQHALAPWQLSRRLWLALGDLATTPEVYREGLRVWQECLLVWYRGVADDLNRRLIDQGVKALPGEGSRVKVVPKDKREDHSGLGGQTLTPYAETSLDHSGTQQLYSAIRNLLALRPGHGEQGPAHGSGVNALTQFEVGEVVATVNQLLRDQQCQQQIEAGLPVTRVLREQLLRSQGKVLPTPVRERMELMESIFQTLQVDPSMQKSAKQVLRRFEAPLLKLALVDEAVLADKDHPARVLLNRFASLCRHTEAIPSAVDRRVSALMDKVSNTEYSPELYASVAAELDQLLLGQQQAHQRNAARVAKACEGQERLHQAHVATKRALAKRLQGRPVPQVLFALLDCGWRDLLVRSYLRGGADDVHWREYLDVVDQLLIWLGEGHASAQNQASRALEAETFLDYLSRELDAASPGQYRHLEVIRELRDWLQDKDQRLAQLPRIKVEGDEWYGIALPNTDINLKADARNQLARWLDRARQLRPGDWLANIQPGEDAEELCLVWVSQDKQQFALVNRAGQKVADWNLVQVAEKLQQGWYRQEEHEWNLVDRGLYGFLQKVFDELEFQRSHDQLTGLLNRKEFERLLESRMPIWRQTASSHALIKIDLDQFGLINNLGNVQVGDAFLSEFAQSLENLLPPAAELSRAGGNEFVILIEQSSVDEGKQWAERLREHIQHFRFEWQEHYYSLTGSLGLVCIADQYDHVSNILKDVDAACVSAKEAGGNRWFFLEDQDAERRKREDVLYWMAQINRGLDENRLRLRCHKIMPIRDDPALFTHYEILLGVRSADGGDILVPPDKFIAAAERYNRMQEVDRWVVGSVLDWLARHPGKIDTLGALSINLSGHTLNDDQFLAFLMARLQNLPVNPRQICFEVTETTTIANITKAADFIRQVKTLGVEFALDDFGTGLSSYEYLKRLPVDYLKIDGCFVKDIAHNKDDYAVVKSINEIGHFMGKKTIAEYVENADVLAVLAEIGVDYAQGYGIERPRLLDEM